MKKDELVYNGLYCWECPYWDEGQCNLPDNLTCEKVEADLGYDFE